MLQSTPAQYPSPETLMTPARHRRAFTLVELLVVVSLIGILAAVVGFSISGGGAGQALGGATRSVMAMVQSAQKNALLHQVRARLIIFNDNKNYVPESDASAGSIDPKVMHYFGVIYAVSDDPTAKAGSVPGIPPDFKPYKTWFAANNGEYLPDGIYFLPSSTSLFAQNLPSFASSSNALTSAYTAPVATAMDDHSGVTTGLMQIQFPIAVAQEGTGDWYYYIEFAPDGYYYNSNNNNNLMIGAATAVTTYTVDFGGAADQNAMFSGVQLRALGSPAIFRSTDDMKPQGSH